MQVKLWHNKEMELWRWSIIDSELNMYTGQQKELHNALEEIEKTIETK